MKITKLEEETEKRKIADTASSLIRDDMVLFLDSSTTSLHYRNLARFDGLQIITNGIVTAAMLSEYTTAKYLYWEGQLFRNEQQSTVQSL